MENMINPVRLYIYNIVNCVGNPDEVCDYIDYIAYKEIENYIKELKSFTRNYQGANCTSILPMPFIRFVNSKKTESKKAPDYFLTNCHINAKLAVNYLKDNQSLFLKNGGKIEDQNIVEQFEKYVNDYRNRDAGAISPKQLSRIIDFSEGPFKEKEENFIRFFFYTIVKVNNYDYATFLSILIKKSWEELLCWHYDRQLKQSKQLLCINDLTAKTKLKEMFDALFRLDEDAHGKIAEQLITIYKYIKTNVNIFSIYENSNVPTAIHENDKSVDDADDYETYISSHILNFMLWLPMITENQKAKNNKYMVLVEQIIDEIRDDINDEFKKEAKMENVSDGGIFVRDKHKEIRKKLIFAMHNIPDLHEQFHTYYGIKYNKRGN